MSDNKLVRSSLESSLAVSSLKSLARQAEVVMLLVDTSSSMYSNIDPHDYTPGAKTSIKALREVVAEIRAGGPVPTIAFGGTPAVRFVDDVPEPAGGTPLHLAIPFAKSYGANRLVIVSDGAPDLAGQTLEEATLFGGRIDVVYAGPSSGHYAEDCKALLRKIAEATGGQVLQGNFGDVKQLTSAVIGLLEGHKEPERGPIVGPGFSVAEVEPTEEDDDEEDDEEDDDDEEDGDDDES